MNVFNLIGAIMILAVFVALFFLIANMFGYKEAVISFGSTFALTAFIVLAVYLLKL